MRRLDPIEPRAGASEWDGPDRKSGKPQKILVEVFPSGGPLSIWREVHVDISRRPGEAVSYANSGGATPLRCRENRSGPTPAQQMEAGSKRRRVVPRCAARIQTEPVKKVRIARCTFCLSNFFTP